jgi:hypothetical protein
MTDLTTRVEAIERHLGMEKPVRVERSQEYKDAMVAAQKAGIPVQFKSDERTKWSDAGRWSFDDWDTGDYRIKPAYEQPAKPAQRVARECEIKMHSDGILRARYKDGGVEFTEWTHLREVLPDE